MCSKIKKILVLKNTKKKLMQSMICAMYAYVNQYKSEREKEREIENKLLILGLQ